MFIKIGHVLINLDNVAFVGKYEKSIDFHFNVVRDDTPAIVQVRGDDPDYPQALAAYEFLANGAACFDDSDGIQATEGDGDVPVEDDWSVADSALPHEITLNTFCQLKQHQLIHNRFYFADTPVPIAFVVSNYDDLTWYIHHTDGSITEAKYNTKIQVYSAPNINVTASAHGVDLLWRELLRLRTTPQHSTPAPDADTATGEDSAYTFDYGKGVFQGNRIVATWRDFGMREIAELLNTETCELRAQLQAAREHVEYLDAQLQMLADEGVIEDVGLSRWKKIRVVQPDSE